MPDRSARAWSRRGATKAHSETKKPGTSALFLLVAKATPETKEFALRVLKTSISADQEEKLRADLAVAQVVAGVASG